MIRSEILCIFPIVVLITTASGATTPINQDWWKTALIYQIYPRSFKDSNGDGIGDLNGITSKLNHIADIGADAIWLSPIYTSPQVDFGYDIANFTNVDSSYGTLNDFSQLVNRAKSLGLKVLLDFVPNHSSHQHPWFKKSIQRIKPYDEYYIWRDAKITNGVRKPPNNWLSVFGGSAWEWNPIRKQYYLHQFASGQPDLNYRSPALDREMKNVLSFWMDRGVEGFRIDAINHMFEDVRFLDEPLNKQPGFPSDDYDYLDHPYTKNLQETYLVLRNWRTLLDSHSTKNKGDPKIILTEAYTSPVLTTKFYTYGSNAPMNFQFFGDLNIGSNALDFKRITDRWLNDMPKNNKYVANWVVGNHDNHRAATRFGAKRVDQISILSLLLPGISIVYNGDEIGMEDRFFSWNETVDPAGCNAGPNRYQLKSRDPERTPFQWDNTISAGFSTNPKTWLPVNNNYRTLNLAAQKGTVNSHYKVFKAVSALKKKPIIRRGSLELLLATQKVLGLIRRLPNSSTIVVALLNISNTPVTVDARTWLNIPPELTIYTSSVQSGLSVGRRINTARLSLPAAATVVLVSADLI